MAAGDAPQPPAGDDRHTDGSTPNGSSTGGGSGGRGSQGGLLGLISSAVEGVTSVVGAASEVLAPPPPPGAAAPFTEDALRCRRGCVCMCVGLCVCVCVCVSGARGAPPQQGSHALGPAAHRTS